jgi:3-hydroxybutyryl-CoA dehydrogenase
MSDIVQVKFVAVLGAGTMGRGIALVAARAGYRVALQDVAQEAVDAGLEGIRATLGDGVERGKVTVQERDAALENIATTTNMAEAVETADLVIEAVFESMEVKKALFRQVDEVAPPAAVLATNTSSLSVTEIAASTRRGEQVVGMHFFNPVHVMQLVEVVKGERTAASAVDVARHVAEAMGKQTIVVRDSPGFATSRLGIALGNEAMRMVESGVAAPEDIDLAMELGYRHPMGPLRLSDLVGLDVRLAITEHLYRELGGEQFRPPQILRRMVRAGKLGKKAGEGFYKWKE